MRMEWSMTIYRLHQGCPVLSMEVGWFLSGVCLPFSPGGYTLCTLAATVCPDWATGTRIRFLLLRMDEGDKASPIDW